MQLQLISFALCPFVHRAGIALREKGAPYEQTYIDLKNKPDWFLAISPRGKVPVLVADGVPLFESAAIVEFIDETHPPRILPEDPFDRARRRAWTEIANDLFSAQYKVFAAKTREDFESAIEALAPLMRRYEEALTDGFLTERGFGLVEVGVAPALYRFIAVEQRTDVRFFRGFPRTAAWARAIAARPSVVDSVPADLVDRMEAYYRERGSYLWTLPRPEAPVQTR